MVAPNKNNKHQPFITGTRTRDPTLESVGFSRFVTMTIGKNRDQEYKAITCLQIQTGVYIYMISKRAEYSPAKLQCLHLQYLACRVGSDVLGVVVPALHRLLLSSNLCVSIHLVVLVLSWLTIWYLAKNNNIKKNTLCT